MLESTIEYLCILISGVMVWAFMTNVTMKRRHSYKVFLIYIAVKSVCTNLLFQIWLSDEMAANNVLRTVYVSLVTVFAIMSYLVMIYTFDESFEKIAVISSVSDLFGSFVASIVIVITDFLENKTVGYIPSPVISFLMPVISGIILYPVLKAGARFWKRIRNWEIKRKKLVMIIFSVYLILSIASMQMEQENIIAVMVTSIAFFALRMILLKTTIDYYYRMARIENDILKRQQSLVKMQYEAVTRQAIKMEQAQEEIKQHLQEVKRLSKQEGVKSEQIEAYVTVLKKQAQELTEGVFCDDWYLDCVLCHIMSECRKRAIPVSFYLQGHHKNEQSENLAQKVLHIINILLGDVQKLEVRITSKKGKAVQKINYQGELSKKTIKELNVYGKQIDAVVEHNKLDRAINIVF